MSIDIDIILNVQQQGRIFERKMEDIEKGRSRKVGSFLSCNNASNVFGSFVSTFIYFIKMCFLHNEYEISCCNKITI